MIADLAFAVAVGFFTTFIMGVVFLLLSAIVANKIQMDHRNFEIMVDDVFLYALPLFWIATSAFLYSRRRRVYALLDVVDEDNEKTMEHVS